MLGSNARLLIRRQAGMQSYCAGLGFPRPDLSREDNLELARIIASTHAENRLYIEDPNDLRPWLDLEYLTELVNSQL